MGDRFDNRPPKPEDHLRKFPVRNGAIMRIAFGCYYLHGHNPKMHDFVGWPNPDKPDAICQELSNFKMWKYRDKTIELDEIHLIEEGYEDVAVSFEDEDTSQYLDVNEWIYSEDDNIIRMTAAANFPTFSDKPIDLRFTIFVKEPDDSAIDAVCHGVITVLPGSPYPEL